MTSLSSLSPHIPSPSYIIDDNFSNSIDRCAPAIQLPFCPRIGDNFTSFPNLFGHRSVDDIENESILFRLGVFKIDESSMKFLLKIYSQITENLSMPNASSTRPNSCATFCNRPASNWPTRRSKYAYRVGNFAGNFWTVAEAVLTNGLRRRSIALNSPNTVITVGIIVKNNRVMIYTTLHRRRNAIINNDLTFHIWYDLIL